MKQAQQFSHKFTKKIFYILYEIPIWTLKGSKLFLSDLLLANLSVTHVQLVTLFLSLVRLLLAQIKLIISEMSYPALQREQLSELSNKEAETLMCVTFNLHRKYNSNATSLKKHNNKHHHIIKCDRTLWKLRRIGGVFKNLKLRNTHFSLLNSNLK